VIFANRKLRNLAVHHPDHLHGAAAAIGQKAQYVSVVESVVDSGATGYQKKKSNRYSLQIGAIDIGAYME
jgi:hypothetical protein